MTLGQRVQRCRVCRRREAYQDGLCGPCMGRLGNEAGRAAEARVWRLLQTAPRPPWVVQVRMASRVEDEQGGDVIVETDRGDAWFQVKVKNRSRAHSSLWAGAIDKLVAGPDVSDEDLVQRALLLLERRYTNLGRF